MSLFTKIEKAAPLGDEPRGPGKCPTPTCTELESGWSPTGQCITCVDAAYAAAMLEDGPCQVCVALQTNDIDVLPCAVCDGASAR